MTSKITHAFLFASLVLLNITTSAFNVTFRVDMSQQSGFTTPQVNGTFNGWCGACFSLTDANGDQIWEGTTNIAAGPIEYKFTADNWGMQETLLAGSTCTTTNFGYTNRALVVSGDVVLPIVCWGACVDCASAPAFYDVTFQVDMNDIMSNVDSVFTTPEVNGTFNAWCGNCNPLTDANGDGIWSDTTEYNFEIDAPFWMKTWFWVIIIVLILVSIFVVSYQRQLKLRKDKEHLEHQVKERTKEIENKNPDTNTIKLSLLTVLVVALNLLLM
jgi:hypothetical protein